MEISSTHINPYALPAPDRREENRVSAEQRYQEGKAATEKAAIENTAPAVYLGREQTVQGKGPGDYAEMLRQARLRQNGGSGPEATPVAQQPLAVQQAISAYQEGDQSREFGGVELLPRVDSYV